MLPSSYLYILAIMIFLHVQVGVFLHVYIVLPDLPSVGAIMSEAYLMLGDVQQAIDLLTLV